ARLGRAQPDVNRYPALSQSFDPGAGNPWVGVFDRDHDAAQPGTDQRIGAGWCLAPMAARFERDVGRRALRRSAGPAQRFGFTMRTATASSPAAADHMPLLDNDAA